MNTRTAKRIRRFLSIVGVLAILSTLVVVPTVSAYTGADAPAYASTFVDDACDLGLIDCDLADPAFASEVNRAVGYQMLTAGFEVLSETARSPFTDVAGEWWEDAANTAFTLGWTNGTSEGIFGGSGVFARQQMCVALDSLLGLDGDGADLSGYPDGADISSWGLAPVGRCVEAGLMGGGTNLNAKGPVNKVDAIIMMVNAANYAGDNEIDVVEVAASSFGVEVDDVLDALEFGGYFVDGELVFADEEEEEEEEGEEEEEEEGGEEEEVEGEEEVVPSGTATVALDSSFTPATIWATGTAFNKVMKLNVSATSAGAVRLNKVKVMRGGLSANAHVSGVSVFDGSDVRHGNTGTSWADDNTMEIDFSSDPIDVPAGTTASVWLKVNMAVGANTGTLTLSLASADYVTADGTLSGTFPITSATIDYRNGATTVAAVTVDAVQVHNNSTPDGTTVVNVNLGTTNQQLATFRLSNSNVEAVHLKSVTLYNNGSAADGDVTNLKVVGPDGTDLVTVAAGTTNKYVTFALDYPMAKSASTKDFKIYGDVANGSTRTFRLLLQNDYDLVVTGDTSLADILPTAAAVNDLAFPIGDRSGANFINMITVSAGTLSFSRASDSPTGNIAAGATGQVLGRWELKPTGEDMELRQFSYSIVYSAATNLAGTLYFKVREADTTDYSTIYSIAGADADYTNNASTYTTTFTRLTAGKTYYLEAIGDVLSTATAGLTYTATAVDITQVKRISTNDIVDPTVGTASANTLTVRTGSLTVTANSSAAAPNIVVGQSDLVTVGTWDFTAGSGEGITLTSVVIDDVVASDIGGNFKELELWIDGAKRSQDSSSTITPAATVATVTFNITPSYTIAAAQSALVEVKAKVLTSAVAGDATLAIGASGVSATGVTSQSALAAVPAAAVNGQAVTVSAAGTLTVARDTVTNVKSSQVVAGTTGVTFGAFKFQTGNIEAVRIKKITVRNIGNNTNGLANIGIYDGTTLINDDTETTANEGRIANALGTFAATLGNDPKSATFDYTANPYVIAKNSSKVLLVKANTTYNATNGQTAQFVIDSIEAEGAGSNTRVYVTQVTETADAAAANAYALGEVVIGSDGTAGNIFASPVTAAVAVAATLDTVDTLIDGVDLVGANAATTYQITKMNPVMSGTTILTEVVSAAATYPYAVGDVIVANDLSAATSNNFHVVTAAVAIGASLVAANTPVDGLDLDAADRITRVPSGFSETTLATAETIYNLGDILAVTDINAVANNGLYTVTNAIAVGGDMTAAAVVASQVVQLQSGAALVTGDYVAKMPTQSTELVSTSAVYAYAVGDVVVVDDDDTAANNGSYVVETAVAVGTTLVGDSLGIGITFTASDRISKLYVKGQEDNLKRLYATKLNFAWVAPASTTLSPGTGIEVGRFTLGADAANSGNNAATLSVTALNFTSLSTVRMTRIRLNDVEVGDVTGTNGANSTNFSSTEAGGALTAQSFEDGQTRTYKILADVGTNITTSVSAQFRFNAGSQFTAGTATWSATNAGTTASSTWTALAGDVTELSSTAVAGAITADTTVPTMIIASSGGTANDSIIDEVFTVTFSERIDPVTINTSLAFGGTVAGVAATATGGIVSPTAAATDVLITGIASLTGNTASDAVATNGTVTLGLAAYSACTTTCVLTITPTGYTAWHATAATGDTGAQTVASTSFVVRDISNNLVTHTGSTSTGITDL